MPSGTRWKCRRACPRPCTILTFLVGLRQRLGGRFGLLGGGGQILKVFLGLLRLTAVDFKLELCDIHATPIKKALPKQDHN